MNRSVLPVLALTLAGGLATAAVIGPRLDRAPTVDRSSTSGAAQTQTRERATELERHIRDAMSRPGWGDDRWSVLVVSLEGGDTLFSHRPEASLLPASNLKLFTTAAALYYLGPEYRYPTFLTAAGTLEDGVVDGDLYVYGTGDPTLSARFFESKTAVWEALADSLQSVGVERIRGDLVGDATYFGGPGIGRGWERSYVTHTYAAPASALSYNDNVVTLRVRPGDSVGGPPDIQKIPRGEVQLRNRAKTVNSGRSWIEVDRTGYDAPIVVRGQIRKGASDVWRAVPVVDPPRFAVSALRATLEDRGIQVTGTIRSAETGRSPITDRSVFAPAFEDGPVVQVLAVHRSPPLLEVLKVINQRSHNLYAESVLRSVGRMATGHGTAAAGEAAVIALMEEAGASTAGVQMDDGSGLSSLDRASARSIVELLAFMAESPFRDEYMATLPEAATSRGLRRMHRTPAAGNLRAKTGTIDRVSALSGYVEAQNGELLAFSILANDIPSTWTAKRVEDRIGARLAGFDRTRPQRGDGQRVAGSGAPDSATTGTRRPRELRVPPGRADSTLAARQAARDSAAAEAPQRTEATFYVIKPGDTMEAIAKKNDTSVGAIREANPDVNPRRLIPGRSLRIPGSGPPS